MPPKKYYTHDEIKEILAPYSDQGWIRRFDLVKSKGQKLWLDIVRDFNIQHPKVEYIVDDIVRSLETTRERKSLVREEMNKLESEGKLIIDNPEEEEKWEKLLQKEREAKNEWEEMNDLARAEQRKLDDAFLIEKAKRGVELDPISDIRQDPAKNTEMLVEEPKFEQKPIKVEEPAEPVKPEEAKELTDLEKEQDAFVAKPPREKEPDNTGPKLKEVEADGEVVYNKDNKEEVKPKIDTLGLPKDAVKRLKDIGVDTVVQFAKMDKGQAKSILGQALYTKHEKLLTS